MPKLTIDLPKDVNEALKKKAKADYRSLTNYITIQLIKLANNEYQNNNQIIDLSALPEGTTIKTTTQKTLTPEEIEEQKKQSFLSLCKEMYGEKFYKEYAPDITREYLSLLPDNMYYNFAEEMPDRLVRAVYTMPIEKQKEYIIEMKHYLEEG